MTTTIIQADIDKAVKEYGDRKSICKCCVIFQAAKRVGVPVYEVYSNVLRLQNGKEVPHGGDSITCLRPEYWQESLGQKIKLPKP